MKNKNNIVNLLNKMIEEENINPSKIKNYLKKDSYQYKTFIKENKLTNLIDTFDEVLNEYSMDNVLSPAQHKIINSNEFKSYSEEKCIWSGLKGIRRSHDKALCDYFDTTDVNIIDSDKHLFEVNNWEHTNLRCVVISEDEIEIIKTNITEYLFKKANEAIIKSFNDIVEIDLNDLIKKEDFELKINDHLGENIIVNVINYLLGSYDTFVNFENNYIFY